MDSCSDQAVEGRSLAASSRDLEEVGQFTEGGRRLQGSRATTQPNTETHEPVVSEGVRDGVDGTHHWTDGQTDDWLREWTDRWIKDKS